jgi:MFS family permease
MLVFRQTRSAVLTALVFAFGCLPYALSGLLMSGIADRHPLRRVLVACDLSSAACVMIMVVPVTPLPVLFVCRFAVAMISPLFAGTRAASLADILQGDQYVLGRSLVRVVSQGSQIIGYGLGGMALVWLSPRASLCLTICTFIGSALLLRLGTSSRLGRLSGGKMMWRESAAVTGRLFGNARIRALLLMWWIPPMFFVVAEGVAAPFADATRAGSLGFGLFLAAMPAGTAVSEVLTGAILPPATREKIALPLAAVSLLPMAAFAIHPPLPLAIALMLLTGSCAAYTLGMDQWFVRAVPEQMRGRAMSLLAAGLMTLQGLGMAIGGTITAIVAPAKVICGAGILGTVTVLVVLQAVHKSQLKAEHYDEPVG